MCGIAGGIHFNGQPFDRSVLQRMTDVISRRGPDDEGMHLDAGAGLGFRRLSIIDLSPQGHQPMLSADKRYCIVFNGEIYNFEILRNSLEAAGAIFKSKTDTEVILQLYQQYGEDCFRMLRGMFAIAIWDTVEKKLLLARDRVGKKPLYYYQDLDRLLFASELKSLYQYPCLDYRINNEAVSEYFSYGFIASPRTVFKAVSKLNPGYYLTIDLQGRRVLKNYWNWKPDSQPVKMSFEEARDLVREKVDESIKIRMRSDVPLGAFLSGGIDSTIVVARMAQFSSTPVKTFTIGFKDKAFDESPYAEIVAKKYNTEHHVDIVDPDYIGLIESVIMNFDEPFADSSALPTQIVSQMIRKHVTVALSGDGGDEVFGGYEIYEESLNSLKFDKLPAILKKAAGWLDPVYPDKFPGRNYLRRISINNPYDRFIDRYKLVNDSEKGKLLSGEFVTDASDFKKRFFEEIEGNKDLLTALRYNDLKHYLEGDILVKVDRTTMHSSIESRSPLLDHELIEFAFCLPRNYLIKNGQKKYIFREAFKKFIPEQLANRPKKGFSLPIASWFRNELKPYFEQMVFDSDFSRAGFINPGYAKHLLKIHLSGKRDLSFHLWIILGFAIWHNTVYKHLTTQTTSGRRV